MARTNRKRATAPTTPPAMAALSDWEWDVGGEGVGSEDDDVDDIEGDKVEEE